MFKYWGSMLLLSLAGVVHAGQEIPDYPVTRVSEHVYVIHGPTETPNPKNKGFMNNPGIVLTTAGVVIVDPGSTLYAGRMVLRQVRKLTDKPVIHVFNTHVHGDHWLGNQAIVEAYPKARIHAHPEMIAEARAGAGAQWVRLMENLTAGASKGTRAVPPTEPLKDGQELKIGGLTFKIYLGEHAHTRTDAMIQVVEDSVLFTGDNALYQRIGRMDDGSFRGNIHELERALALKLKVYVPGHGTSGGPDVIRPYLEYLRTVYNEAARLMEQDLADYEMKPVIGPKLKPYWKWSGFEEEFGRHVSLAVLEAEKAAF